MRRENKEEALIQPEQYPDTAAGAIEYLRDFSCHDVREAVAHCDPWAKGVWMIKLPHDQLANMAIVYLAGYPDVMGDEREENDFESGVE